MLSWALARRFDLIVSACRCLRGPITRRSPVRVRIRSWMQWKPPAAPSAGLSDATTPGRTDLSEARAREHHTGISTGFPTEKEEPLHHGEVRRIPEPKSGPPQLRLFRRCGVIEGPSLASMIDVLDPCREECGATSGAANGTK